MAKTIITSGATYVDIDAVACAYLYKDILTAKGIESEIVFPGPINSSVTKSMLDWGVVINKDISDRDVRFVVVDVSERSKFPSFVTDDKIDVVYDHRLMFLNEWKGKEIKLVIEEVGACATLVWEEVKKQGLEDRISDISVKLAYTAIFSNTLNFKAGVTTKRDEIAFSELQKICSLGDEWIKDYYQESETGVYRDVANAIKNDTKLMEIPGTNEKMAIGQMELWNSRDFVNKNKDIIRNVLSEFSTTWFMTAPSISEGKNYLFTESDEIKKILEKIIDAKFDGDIGITNKLWLRKEILKKLLK
jgi:inorganic pyrophosphatase/exopolyphosphatase